MSDLFEALTGLALLAPWALLGVVVIAGALWLRRRAGAPSAPFSPAAVLDPTPGAEAIRRSATTSIADTTSRP